MLLKYIHGSNGKLQRDTFGVTMRVTMEKSIGVTAAPVYTAVLWVIASSGRREMGRHPPDLAAVAAEGCVVRRKQRPVARWLASVCPFAEPSSRLVQPQPASTKYTVSHKYIKQSTQLYLGTAGSRYTSKLTLMVD